MKKAKNRRKVSQICSLGEACAIRSLIPFLSHVPHPQKSLDPPLLASSSENSSHEEPFHSRLRTLSINPNDLTKALFGESLAKKRALFHMYNPSNFP